MIDLSSFDNSEYEPGASIFRQVIWYVINVLIFKSSVPFPSGLKRLCLKLFGAKVGKGVVIKPNVNIKYPWLLSIGNNSWIGENVWIDNLDKVSIASNCCISQGAMLLTGNHNYKSTSFDLVIAPIFLAEGCWIGAKAVVCPGVILNDYAVLSVGSVATKDLEACTIYQGIPAIAKGQRIFLKTEP